MVEFKNISFSYSKESGIYDIDLKVKDSEFCFLVGPTGSGKSSPVSYTHLTLPTSR